MYRIRFTPLLWLLTLTTVACNLFQPPTTPSPVTSTRDTQSTQGNPITAEKTVSSALRLTGIIAQGISTEGSLTSSAGLKLSTDAILYAGKGYVLNSNNQIQPQQILWNSTATQCVDNSTARLCNTIKSNLVPTRKLSAPNITTLRAQNTPATYQRTWNTSTVLNGAQDVKNFAAAGRTLLVKGNLTVNSRLVLSNTTLVVKGSLQLNGGVELNDSQIVAEQISANGQNTLNTSKLLSEANLNLNGNLTTTGNTTLAAEKAILFSGALSVNASNNEQLAVAAGQNITLNGRENTTLPAVLWSGGSIQLNRQLDLQGALVALGNITLNGSTKVQPSNQLNNPDLAGLTNPALPAFHGQFTAPITGDYTFWVKATQGFRFGINGKFLNRLDRTQATIDRITLHLDAGSTYDLELDVTSGDAAVEVQNPTGQFQSLNPAPSNSTTNVAADIKVLQTNPLFKQWNITIDEANSVNITNGNAHYLYAQEKGINSVVYALISEGTVRGMIRYFSHPESNVVYVQNLEDGTARVLGTRDEINQIIQSQDQSSATFNRITQTAVDVFIGDIPKNQRVPLLSITLENNSTSSQSITKQAILASNPLTSTSVSPMAAGVGCFEKIGEVEGSCHNEYVSFKNAVWNLIVTSYGASGTVAAVGTVITSAKTLKELWTGLAPFRGLLFTELAYAPTGGSNFFNFLPAENAFWKCVEDHCPGTVAAVPEFLNLRARVKQVATGTLAVIAVPEPEAGSRASITVTMSTDKGSLSGTIPIQTVSYGAQGTVQMPIGNTFSVASGNNWAHNANITYKYTCPSEPTTVQATITFKSVQNTAKVPVTIRCMPEALQLSPPGALQAKVDQSASTSFGIKFDYDPEDPTQLVWTLAKQSLPDFASFEISPLTGNLKPQETATVNINMTCFMPGEGKLNLTVNSNSDDVRGLEIPVSARCINPGASIDFTTITREKTTIDATPCQITETTIYWVDYTISGHPLPGWTTKTLTGYIDGSLIGTINGDGPIKGSNSVPGSHTLKGDLTGTGDPVTGSTGFTVEKPKVKVLKLPCDPPPPPNDPNGGRAQSVQDPHLLSFDGKHFDSHLLGEFYYLKPRTGTGLTVQARHELVSPTKFPTKITAVVAQAGQVKVEVRTTSPYVLLNGQPLTEDFTQVGEVTITRADFSTTVTTPYGQVTLARNSKLVNVYLSQVPRGLYYWGGLGTPNNDVADDFTMSNGVVTDNVDTFMDSWRVNTHAESLFSYEGGQGPETFNRFNPFIGTQIPDSVMEPYRVRARELLNGYCATSTTPSDVNVNAIALDLYAGFAETDVAESTCQYMLSGTITNSLLSNQPAAQVPVTVISEGLNACNTTTDDQGRYTCTLTPNATSTTAPTVQLLVNGSPAASGQFATQAPQGGAVLLALNAQAAVTTLQLSGNVKSADGTGGVIQKATVNLKTAFGSWSALTDTNGNYQLNLPVPATQASPLQVEFSVRKDDLLTRTTVPLTFTVNQINFKEVNLELSRLTRFNATLQNLTRADFALEGVLTITLNDGTVLCTSNHLSCSDELKITQNTPATATVTGEWGSVSQAFTLIPGQPNYTLNFQVKPTLVAFEGQVTDLTGKAISGVSVNAQANWLGHRTATTDQNGQFVAYGYQRTGSTVGPVELVASTGVFNGKATVNLTAAQVPPQQLSTFQQNLQVTHQVQVNVGLNFDHLATDLLVGAPSSNLQVKGGGEVYCNSTVYLNTPNYTCKFGLKDTSLTALTLTYSGAFGQGEVVIPVAAWSNTGQTTLQQDLNFKTSRVKIQGLLQNSQGQPLSGLTVKFSGAFTSAVKSDSTGHYQITVVTPNTQNLKVTAKVSDLLNVETRNLDLAVSPQTLTTYTTDLQFVQTAPGRARWSIPLGGTVYSGITSLTDGTLVMPVSGFTGGKLMAVLPNSEVLWTLPLPAGEIYSTPAVDAEDNIYLGTKTGQVLAVSKSGEIKWTHQTGDTVYAAPVLVGGTVLVSSADGKVYAFSKNGALLWSYATGSPIRLPVVSNGDAIYVAPENKTILQINSNGQLVKQYALTAALASPMVITPENHLLVFTQDNKRLRIRSDFSVQTTALDRHPIAPVMLGSDAELGYVSNGSVLQYWNHHLNTVWYQDLTGTFTLTSLPTSTGVLVPADSRLLDFNTQGQLNWTFTSQNTLSSHPILLNSGIYVADVLGNLYAVNTQSQPDNTWFKFGATSTNNANQTVSLNQVYLRNHTVGFTLDGQPLGLQLSNLRLVQNNRVLCENRFVPQYKFDCEYYVASNTDINLSVSLLDGRSISKVIRLNDQTQISDPIDLHGVLRVITVRASTLLPDPTVQVWIGNEACSLEGENQYVCKLLLTDPQVRQLSVHFVETSNFSSFTKTVDLDAGLKGFEEVNVVYNNNRSYTFTGSINVHDFSPQEPFIPQNLRLSIRAGEQSICDPEIVNGQYTCSFPYIINASSLTYELAYFDPSDQKWKSTQRTVPFTGNKTWTENFDVYRGLFQSKVMDAPTGQQLNLFGKLTHGQGEELCRLKNINGILTCTITSFSAAVDQPQLYLGLTEFNTPFMAASLPSTLPNQAYTSDIRVNLPAVRIHTDVQFNGGRIISANLMLNGDPLNIFPVITSQGVDFMVPNLDSSNMKGVFLVGLEMEANGVTKSASVYTDVFDATVEQSQQLHTTPVGIQTTFLSPVNLRFNENVITVTRLGNGGVVVLTAHALHFTDTQLNVVQQVPFLEGEDNPSIMKVNGTKVYVSLRTSDPIHGTVYRTVGFEDGQRIMDLPEANVIFNDNSVLVYRSSDTGEKTLVKMLADGTEAWSVPYNDNLFLRFTNNGMLVGTQLITQDGVTDLSGQLTGVTLDIDQDNNVYEASPSGHLRKWDRTGRLVWVSTKPYNGLDKASIRADHEHVYLQLSPALEVPDASGLMKTIYPTTLVFLDGASGQEKNLYRLDLPVNYYYETCGGYFFLNEMYQLNAGRLYTMNTPYSGMVQCTWLSAEIYGQTGAQDINIFR